jgi:hypothetical protein
MLDGQHNGTTSEKRENPCPIVANCFQRVLGRVEIRFHPALKCLILIGLAMAYYEIV